MVWGEIQQIDFCRSGSRVKERMGLRVATMRFFPLLATAFLLASVSAITPALAQGKEQSAQLELAKQAEKLKPGEWVLKPQIAREGPVLVYVDLSRQLATVYRNGVRIGVSTISSGKDGYETPTGVFTILEKD